MYKKLLLWNDLNISLGQWCSQRTIDIIAVINQFEEDLRFKPTKMEYEEATLESRGFYGFSEASPTNESIENLSASIESMLDMESLIKKNFLNKTDRKLLENNTVQKTLREDLEKCQQELFESKR